MRSSIFWSWPRCLAGTLWPGAATLWTKVTRGPRLRCRPRTTPCTWRRCSGSSARRRPVPATTTAAPRRSGRRLRVEAVAAAVFTTRCCGPICRRRPDLGSLIPSIRPASTWAGLRAGRPWSRRRRPRRAPGRRRRAEGASSRRCSGLCGVALASGLRRRCSGLCGVALASGLRRRLGRTSPCRPPPPPRPPPAPGRPPRGREASTRTAGPRLMAAAPAQTAAGPMARG
mmetsp:Transcript_60679/g.198608  ORF Transcript_60679/g.198608 Transcript_60679/m.198608 type:complete len:229 (-) Transcript_60679:790-1476(-)